MHGKLDGTWTVDFPTARSGTTGLWWNGRKGGGHYVISGSTIMLTPKHGGNCKTKGKYRFTLSGNTLRFTTINDTCTERRDILTYGPWTTTG